MSAPVTIRQCKLAEIEQNARFPALFAEYAAECALHELPPPDEKLAAYRALDDSGIFHILGAFDGDDLLGFLAFLLPVIPHYGVAIAVGESFFVASAHRKKGVGLKLVHAAEQQAQQAGAPALMLSAPVGSPLERVLPVIGYRETNRVFLRKLSA